MVIATARLRDEGRQTTIRSRRAPRDAFFRHQTHMINTAETNTAPDAPRISVRISAENPHHHLWNNHGTWWVHFTEHLPGFTKRRARRSLGTRDLAEAIRRRDILLRGVGRPGP